MATAKPQDDPPSPASQPQPQWGQYGLEICNTRGNTAQQSPRIVPLSDGNRIVVWEDGRAGYTGIFAQKLDDQGNKLWSDVGVSLCLHGNQAGARLIDDGAGGAIIVWQGYCNGSSDIFAQRLNARGEPAWGSGVLIICSAEANQFGPELASDGAGGAIITWYDYRGGSGEDIYAQRVSAGGELLWPANGIAVSAGPGTQWYPQIAADGTGGAYLAWSDGRTGAADNNIFAQRLNAGGQALWAKDGVPVCEAAANQEKTGLLVTPQGPLIAWNDSRSGNVDIYAQKLGPTGSPLWEKDGVPVITAPFNQLNPRLAADDAGGAVIVWTDQREVESAIFAQKLGSDGKPGWEEGGRLLIKSPAKQDNPEIVKLKTPDWFIVLEDHRKGYPLLFTQKINSAGVLLWPASGAPVSPGTGPQNKASAAVTTSGDCFLVWEDRRSGNSDLFAQLVSGTQGTPLLAAGGLVFCDTPGSVQHQNARLIDAGRGEIMAAFEDTRNGFLNIYAQKVSGNGVLLWGRDGIPVARIRGDQINPGLVTDKAGGAIVCWEDQRNPNIPRIFAQRINAKGGKGWAQGSIPVAKIEAKQSRPEIVSDGAGGAIICWEDDRDPLSLKDVYLQRISPKGELLWGKGGLLVAGENGEQGESTIVTDGAGGAYVVWTDYRRGERNPDIYAQRVSADGKLLWDKEGVLVCGAPDVQRTPQIRFLKDGGAIITWTDKGGGSYDIYAQRLSADGKPLWLSDGIPVNQAARTQQNPLIDGGQIIVWEDYRLGNWDIYANSLTEQGKLMWGEEGLPVVSLPQTQYAPVVAPWKNGSMLLAWEDYRNNKQYEIFIQKVSGDGKPDWSVNGLMVRTTNGARSPKLLPLPVENAFVVVWEDYTGGGKALFGQKFTL
ncbi:MAG: hypothetical protein MUC35_02350 [Candidatus Margulisbacteria bacterium]|nr:hypothetical protein [Candidatus Margulisiibacteriota bacterium]